jgi:hypothetical protein
MLKSPTPSRAAADESAAGRSLYDILLVGAPPLLAADDAPVLWVFRDYEGRWCVRTEGGETEAVFTGREKALDFAREHGRAAGSYRLFVQLRDGRVTQELFNLGER